jgi:isocitrate lyase
LAHAYRDEGMSAYVRLQRREFDLERQHGYRGVKHQSFVGAGYFDDITQVIMGAESSITAMRGSTEEDQFKQQTPDFLEAERHHASAETVEPVRPGEPLLRELE